MTEELLCLSYHVWKSYKKLVSTPSKALKLTPFCASNFALKGDVQLLEWTIREQLILASAVQRSGDQNW